MRNYTDLNIIIDRSGSMSSIREAMNESLAGYLDNLKKNGHEVHVSAVQFDDKYETMFTDKPINEAPAIKIEPRGGTALLGAIGRSVDEIGKRLSNMAEDQRPNEVIVVIVSDGGENVSHNNEWSRQYTQQVVFDKIGHQRDVYNWNFIFMGSNQDAIATANMYNIPTSNAVRYSNTARSVKKMSEVLTKGTIGLMSRSVGEKMSGAPAAAFEAADQDTRDEDEKTAEAPTRTRQTYQRPKGAMPRKWVNKPVGAK